MIITSGLIVAIVIVGIATRSIIRNNKAIQLAKEFLAEKYGQEMVYESIRCSWFVDPVQYYVRFVSTSNPEIDFEVIISNDLSTPEERINEYGYFSNDNYLLRRFMSYMEINLMENVNAVWNVGADVSVFINNQPLYSYNIPDELSEEMPPESMEQYIDYDIYITVNSLINRSMVHNEARKIISFIQSVVEHDYNPRKILVWYKDKPNSSDSIHFSFENHWNSYDLAEIEKIIYVKLLE